MDVIELSSYTNEEKVEIFKKHLLPRAIGLVIIFIFEHLNIKMKKKL
jgi:ATP-dependent Lon protease